MYQYTLKELRARHQLTQSDLAKAMKVSTSKISYLEHDSTKVSLQFAKNIATFYNIPVESIYFGKISDLPRLKTPLDE
jgi:putative transcriptional regulator